MMPIAGGQLRATRKTAWYIHRLVGLCTHIWSSSDGRQMNCSVERLRCSLTNAAMRSSVNRSWIVIMTYCGMICTHLQTGMIKRDDASFVTPALILSNHRWQASLRAAKNSTLSEFIIAIFGRSPRFTSINVAVFQLPQFEWQYHCSYVSRLLFLYRCLHRDTDIH